MKESTDALWASIVRTLTPVIVGAILGWLASINLAPDPGLEAALTIALSSAFTAVYYILVRLFERYVSPRFGWLLGIAKEPAYTDDPPA